MKQFNGFRLDYTNCNHLPKPTKAEIKEAVEELIYRAFPGTEQVLPKHYPLITRHYEYNAIQMVYDAKNKAWMAEHFFIENKRRSAKAA